jgi:hypothetical protein
MNRDLTGARRENGGRANAEYEAFTPRPGFKNVSEGLAAGRAAGFVAPDTVWLPKPAKSAVFRTTVLKTVVGFDWKPQIV